MQPALRNSFNRELEILVPLWKVKNTCSMLQLSVHGIDGRYSADASKDSSARNQVIIFNRGRKRKVKR